MPIEDLNRRIVCAAIRAANGDILLGIRHYSQDMGYAIDRDPDGIRFENRHGDDQGFANSWGQYLTRKEAYLVAVHNNQIIKQVDPEKGYLPGHLYSENLY
jgi:hypothetical protein